MKILIFFDSETGEIWFYQPSEEGESIFIEPRIKKKEWETEKKDERTH